MAERKQATQKQSEQSQAPQVPAQAVIEELRGRIAEIEVDNAILRVQIKEMSK